MKATVRLTLTHNPWGEAYWASGLRENLTSRSYGEGLETGRALTQVPRQSFTRQRTIAWLNRCRRLAKDFENLSHNALAFVQLASIRLMVRKLCNPS